MRAAGSILLLLLAIDMVFARPEGTSKATHAEPSEADFWWRETCTRFWELPDAT
jgi:hypothetical protein